MGKIRFTAALLVGKLAAFLLRHLTGRGTNTPGVLMQKLCPDALSRFTMPKLVICVTGTNGKTGTSNLVTQLLRHAGMTVANNSEGSNMAPGLLTTLTQNATLSGRIKTDAAVLEVDERSSPYIYRYLTPHYLLCTNLFRDSIKRNGHSAYIFDKINDWLPQDTVLLLNGNDPVSGLLGQGKNTQVYFAVERTALSQESCQNIVSDCRSCPSCHKPLAYEFYHYHHIGKPLCDCGFALPNARFSASDVDFETKTFVFNDAEGEAVTLPFSGNNLFEVFNLTAAVGVCVLGGVSLETLAQGIACAQGAKGRFEQTEQPDGRRVVTMLCKNQNPVSASQSFAYLDHVDGEKDVVLVITDSKDAVHGAEDISWLYDTDFERLAQDDVRSVLIGGTRCYDVALRLVLAGASEQKLALFSSYDALCEQAPTLVGKTGTAVVYFELYAKPIADRVQAALTKEEASR